MSLSVPSTSRRAHLVALSLALALVGACSDHPPEVAASPPSVREAASRTLAVATGHFEIDIEIGATEGEGARLLRTTLSGSFDRPRSAYEATLDLDAVVESLPGLTDGIAPGVVGDVLQIRVIGRDAWGRNGSDAPWRAAPGRGGPLGRTAGTAGPDELLALLAAADEPAQDLGDGRYTGHIGAAGLRAVEGAPEQLTALVAGLPGGLGDRLLRYEVDLDGAGLVRHLLLEVDLDAMAEAAGEPAPQGVVFRWELTLQGLGAAVTIEPPRT